MKKRRGGIYEKYIKRLLDVIAAAFLLLILLPVFILITVLVYVNLGTPIFFRQERPGLNERLFIIYKFKSMADLRDENGVLLPDEKRMTKFGAWIRAASLDELPELINILKGDMSFVGPRPLLTQYLPLYNEWQKRRHLVRPGLSGLAQVYGRNMLTWEEKFRFDIYYAEHITLREDLRIIMLTLGKVFKKEGIHSENSATMEAFQAKGQMEEEQRKGHLIIVGAGGHGRSAADVAIKMQCWKEIAFLDDRESENKPLGLNIIGTFSYINKFKPDSKFFVAVGDNLIRKSIMEKAETEQVEFAVLIHPDAVIGEEVSIGEGTVIMAGSVINCCTKIGKGCIVNTAASVDHDCCIGDYVHISPGVSLAGSVCIGNESWLGIGCIISNQVTITHNCIIGAGALVLKNIEEPGTYIGIPAQRISQERLN